MAEVQGLAFSDDSAALVEELITRLQYSGTGDAYCLPKLGELRMAHYAPTIGQPRARGVFVQIIPSSSGATIVRRVGHTGGQPRTSLHSANLDQVVAYIESWRAQNASKVRKLEKAEPNQPGTVSGGRPESKRSKF